jgi:SAM-dependent methyltransferase
MPDFHYIGAELEVFRHAHKWKSYVGSKLKSLLVGEVLEVGAGIGTVTQAFYDGSQECWVCLEPDSQLAEQIPKGCLPNPDRCRIAVGAVRDLGTRELFDAVLYMDVLEHIEDDREELVQAAGHLKPKGSLIVLAPALPCLFSQFDAAIGHYRRYTKKSLRAIAPGALAEERCHYLDAVGLLASAGNRLLLRSGEPNLRQIRFWDSWLVPISRVIDPLLAYSVGRSVVGVWRRRD